MGALTSLGSLRLAWNGFTGGIPAELGRLTRLWSLSLCGNALDVSATLPSALETRRTEGTLTVSSCLRVADAAGAEGTTLSFGLTHSTWPVRGGGSVAVQYETEDGTATSADDTGVKSSVTARPESHLASTRSRGRGEASPAIGLSPESRRE